MDIKTVLEDFKKQCLSQKKKTDLLAKSDFLIYFNKTLILPAKEHKLFFCYPLKM